MADDSVAQESGTPHRCNICGGRDEDHHHSVAFEKVFGATVKVYSDGHAGVVPWFTASGWSQ